MTKGHSYASLSARLSRGLILLSSAVLGILCAAVYFSVRHNLDIRQQERLETLAAIVSHLLTEKPGNNDDNSLLGDLAALVRVERDLYLKVAERDSVLRFGSDEGNWPKRSREKVIALPAAKRGGTSLTATVVLDTSHDDDILDKLATILLFAAVIGSLTISVGGVCLTRFGLRPVKTLADEIGGLALLSSDKKLDISEIPAELVPLVQQFSDLLERLKRAYSQMESFNADVAHELRTPLAITIANCELAMRDETDVNKLLDCIGSSLEEMQRLAGIVNDMLFLSQADSGAKARRSEVASVAAVCAEVVDYYDAVLGERNLLCRIQGDGAADIDAALFRRALSNLLNNAARYALAGSTIVITLTIDEGQLLRVSVVNSGEPIRPEHLPHLFTRFFRADPSRAKGVVNHGLGLSIVHAIARMHDGDVFARSAENSTEIGFRLALGRARARPVPARVPFS